MDIANTVRAPPAQFLRYNSCNVKGAGLTFTPQEEADIAAMYAYYKQREPAPPEPKVTYEGDLHLPPEIGSIIQDFARPLLRYPREYKEALQELDLWNWPALKAKLSTNDAFTVLKFLQSYLVAHRAEVRAKQFYMFGGSSYPWTKKYRDKLRIYDELLARL